MPPQGDGGSFLAELTRDLPTLSFIPQAADMVDVFGCSGEMPDMVEEVIKAGPRAVWMQEGVIHVDSVSPWGLVTGWGPIQCQKRSWEN